MTPNNSSSAPLKQDVPELSMQISFFPGFRVHCFDGSCKSVRGCNRSISTDELPTMTSCFQSQAAARPRLAKDC
jgi:hypothetical protein